MSAELGAKLGVGLTALIYLGLGVGLMLDPAGLIAAVGVNADSPEARAEIRAMYGGLELGVGLWLLACMRQPAWHRPGLLFVGMSLGGLFLGRLSGVLIEGTGWETHAPYLASELLGASLGFGLWAWTGRTSSEP